jgi:hypothetical protein
MANITNANATNSFRMRILRGLQIPKKIGKREHYDFSALQHGDAIEVTSPNSAREVFRRWRKRTDTKAQLVRSREPGQEGLLFFIDETRKRPAALDDLV